MGSGVYIKDLFTSIFNFFAHIDGQTKAVLSDVVSADAIVDPNSSVTTGSPLHPARLRAGPRWVRAPVLSVRDSEVRVVRLGLDALDGLNRVRDVGVVDERTVPDEVIVNATPRTRTDKIPLFFQKVDKFDIAILAKVPLQPLLAEGIKVLDVSDINVPRRTRVDGERESGRKWARILTPANLQPAVVERQALEGSDLVESHSSSWVDEGNELESPSEKIQTVKTEGRTYCNMLILHVPDALQHTSPDGITQVLGGGLGVDVPEIDRPVQRLVSVQTTKAAHTIHASEIRSERQVGGHGRPEVALILHG